MSPAREISVLRGSWLGAVWCVGGVMYLCDAMIPFARVDQRVVSRLEAEGTDAWRLNEDRVLAVNGAQWLLTSAAGSLFEAKKASGEGLRDLNHTALFQTSEYGEIALDRLLLEVVDSVPSWEAGHRLWTVVSVYPEFEGVGNLELVNDPLKDRSRLRQDARFVAPVRAAKRYTHEEWSVIRNDPFSPGNDRFGGELKGYGYVYGTRPLSLVGLVKHHSWLPLKVFPHKAGTRRLVAVSYMKVPYEVPKMELEEEDPKYSEVQLEWPDSLEELLVALTLRLITYKQGDGTTVNSLTAQETQMLLRVLG